MVYWKKKEFITMYGMCSNHIPTIFVKARDSKEFKSLEHKTIYLHCQVVNDFKELLDDGWEVIKGEQDVVIGIGSGNDGARPRD